MEFCLHIWFQVIQVINDNTLRSIYNLIHNVWM